MITINAVGSFTMSIRRTKQWSCILLNYTCYDLYANPHSAAQKHQSLSPVREGKFVGYESTDFCKRLYYKNVMLPYVTQVHKCHDRDSNPQSVDLNIIMLCYSLTWRTGIIYCGVYRHCGVDRLTRLLRLQLERYLWQTFCKIYHTSIQLFNSSSAANHTNAHPDRYLK